TGSGLRTAAPQERRSGLVGGGGAEGDCGTKSIARRRTPGQAASLRGQSNPLLSEVLRAGRASTAGRSPLSPPHRILMCHIKQYTLCRHSLSYLSCPNQGIKIPFTYNGRTQWRLLKTFSSHFTKYAIRIFRRSINLNNSVKARWIITQL